MARRAIPRPAMSDAETRAFCMAVKERLEQLSGERGTRLAPLVPETATPADVARRLNELLEILQ